MKRKAFAILSIFLLVLSFLGVNPSAIAAQEGTKVLTQEKINEFMTEINNFRGEYCLPPVTYNATIQSGADIRAAELTELFKHERPNGEDFTTAFPGDSGVFFENAAGGSNSSKATFEQWKNSKQGHREAMLIYNLQSITLGAHSADSGYGTYWVLVGSGKVNYDVKTEGINETIKYETIVKENPELDLGEEVVIQEGKDGSRTVNNIQYFNVDKGELVYECTESETVEQAPVDKIVEKGTKVTEVKEEQKTVEIPFEKITFEDSTLEKGEEVIEQEGVNGEETITYEVTYVNGEEVNREVKSEVITTEPINEIVKVGTKVTEVKEEQETVEIPFETIIQEDPRLDKGEEVIEQEGVNGKETITYEITYVNGKEVSREVKAKEITTEAINEIVKVGTKVTEIKEEQETVEIPFNTIVVEDPTLGQDEKVIEQEGVVGQQTIIYVITYVNGKEVSREVKTEEVIKEAIDRIVRVGEKITEVKEEHETIELPFETITQEDPTLEKGEQVIEQDGVVGEQTITYEITYVNGEEVSREVKTDEVTKEAIDRIVKVGTKVTEVKEEKETVELPFETVIVEDPTLTKGIEAILQEGVNGEQTFIYEVTYVNGVEVSREVTLEELVRDAVNQVIVIGTNVPEEEDGSGSSDEENIDSDSSSKEEDGSGNNSDLIVKIEDETLSGSTSFDSNNVLPKTATSTFNWLIGGFIAMVAGVAGLFIRREEKQTED